ncbi:NosR/NirI family protein [Seohaeicola zhoushanensis]|uniref:FMN-binding protein n=1 Tax=Seohaeicola zhoushanensis TaxID=1569283 RepID=A0A8J3GZV7_9RHOB|nr:FMN-binding protein [Seohaeicola zhoushanensis]
MRVGIARAALGRIGAHLIAAMACLALLAGSGAAESLLPKFLGEADPAELAAGADAFGPVRADAAVAPVLKAGETVAWAFLTSDWVPTTGYSGKPIHVLAAVSPEAVLTGVKLVKHSEPIVLVGIPEARIREVTEGYSGLDLAKAQAHHDAEDIDIVSGATVTIMVIDDSILRAGIKVAQALGLGGFTAAAPTGPTREIDPAAGEVTDWQTLAGNGALRRFVLDVDTVNADFAALGDKRTAKAAEPAPGDDHYVDLWAALVSQPAIGRSLLGEAAFANLQKRLKQGDEAILLAGSGRWSFKGSGYVRGGIFDRIQVIQGEISHRFRDREHSRVVTLAAEGAPEFAEKDIFIIPAAAGFDPAAPWRLQMLVQRAVGPIEKVFRTYELAYDIPSLYTRALAAAPQPETRAEVQEGGRDALWLRIWETKRVQVITLAVALALLSGIFFFQQFATRNARTFAVLRNLYLVFTLVFLGWYANAQLSVVNVLAVFSAMFSEFRWDTFLMDPLIFLLWFATAAAILFWARGAYCGWLCPFGALQELSNKLARLARVPQVKLPWGLHERLWAVKYILFLGLFGMSLYSLDLAEHYAEVEPFKTAIILKFARPLPYVLFALAMLLPGLFIERFYCRYVCPLGGGLAIPARLHMFRWLKRYRECGNPCQRCAQDCPVEAIHPTGEINPNECISCLNCQVLYQDHARCPVVIAKDKRRAKDAQSAAALAAATARDLGGHPNARH